MCGARQPSTPSLQSHAQCAPWRQTPADPGETRQRRVPLRFPVPQHPMHSNDQSYTFGGELSDLLVFRASRASLRTKYRPRVPRASRDTKEPGQANSRSDHLQITITAIERDQAASRKVAKRGPNMPNESRASPETRTTPNSCALVLRTAKASSKSPQCHCLNSSRPPAPAKDERPERIP